MLLTVEVFELPLRLKGIEQPLEVAARFFELGLGNLHVVEVDDGVYSDVAALVILANHLVVNLAARRNVDHQVVLQGRVAGQSKPRLQSFTPREALLGFRDRIEVGCVGSDAELREFTLRHQALATPADSAPATDRVDVHAEFPSSPEHGGAQRESTPLSGGREHDECVGFLFDHLRNALLLCGKL